MATFFLNAKRQKNLVVFLFGFLVLILSGRVQAQQTCDPASAVGQAGSCQAQPFNLPNCFRCIADPNPQFPPQCQPQATLCDDGNSCTEDDCAIDPPGCTNIPLISAGDPDLETQCYICEPTANGVIIDNGVCDSGAGETCVSNPEDCLVPGETCNLNPTPPASCTAVPNANAVCADGDRCTFDFCQDVPGPTACIHDPRSCDPIPDGCCPGNCTGPIFGGTGCSPNDPNCDPDCWSPQDCGDAEVQPPETCDDSVPSGEAGIRPNGQPVGTAACRDAGDPDECTYCGDGILQPLTEECDGNLLGACGGNGCNTATCQCNTLIDCLQGSGNVFGGTGGPGCDGFASCSLHQDGATHPLGNLLILGILAGILGLGCLAQRRA